MPADPVIELLRRRIWAGWIDVFLLAIAGIVLSIATGQFHAGSWTTIENGIPVAHRGLQVNLEGAAFFSWAAICLVYYYGAEALTGQTIGKQVMGLRVVTIDGRPAGAGQVLIRTLGRIVDVLPVFYLVGWLAMRGPRRPPQRLGDRMAGTTVALAR